MKHVILNLTLAEAEAMLAIIDSAMEAGIPFRAINKLQDAIRERVTAGRRPTA